MYSYNDGGRSKSGFKSVNDCGVRAVSIACEMSYNEARQLLKNASKTGKKRSGRISDGIYKEDMSSALKTIGWEWHSAPKFEGRKAKYYDLPNGRVIARMAKHFVAIIDRNIYDTWDCSEKMIYGYWIKTGE